jgi:FMN reductase
MTVTAVVGNLKPKSRTARAAVSVARAIAAADGETPAPVTLVDLCDYTAVLFEPASTELQDLRRAVSTSAVVVVASPTYKATYTGILKTFFDGFGNDGLAGVVAVPVMMGAGSAHAMAPEVHLRPLLVELGATVPSRALYVLEQDEAVLDGVIAQWAIDAVPAIVRSVRPAGFHDDAAK